MLSAAKEFFTAYYAPEKKETRAEKLIRIIEDTMKLALIGVLWTMIPASIPFGFEFVLRVEYIKFGLPFILLAAMFLALVLVALAYKIIYLLIRSTLFLKKAIT